MATKPVRIRLGQRPGSFRRLVEFPMHDGTTGCMTVSYVYRTRREFAQLQDELQTPSEQPAPPAAADGERVEQPALAPFWSRVMDTVNADSVIYVMKIIDGWDLEVPFGSEAVAQLVDEMPNATRAICATYREAIVDGRLGN